MGSQTVDRNAPVKEAVPDANIEAQSQHRSGSDYEGVFALACCSSSLPRLASLAAKMYYDQSCSERTMETAVTSTVLLLR